MHERQRGELISYNCLGQNTLKAITFYIKFALNLLKQTKIKVANAALLEFNDFFSY